MREHDRFPFFLGWNKKPAQIIPVWIRKPRKSRCWHPFRLDFIFVCAPLFITEYTYWWQEYHFKLKIYPPSWTNHEKNGTFFELVNESWSQIVHLFDLRHMKDWITFSESESRQLNGRKNHFAVMTNEDLRIVFNLIGALQAPTWDFKAFIPFMNINKISWQHEMTRIFLILSFFFFFFFFFVAFVFLIWLSLLHLPLSFSHCVRCVVELPSMEVDKHRIER